MSPRHTVARPRNPEEAQRIPGTRTTPLQDSRITRFAALSGLREGSLLAAYLLLAAMLAIPALAHAQQVPARIVMQSSPLAGFRHYEAPNLWGEIRPGDALALVREIDNPHDRNAVRVEWRTFKLGYVPRAENIGVARQLDHGTPLVARVSKVQTTRAPNKRIEFEIYLPQ